MKKKSCILLTFSISDTIFQLLEKLIYNISIIKIYKLIYLQICILYSCKSIIPYIYNLIHLYNLPNCKSE